MAESSPQKPAKPYFWRIQGIKTSEEKKATEWLESQVKELAILEGQGWSLATDSERTLCATVTNYERPTPPPGIRNWYVDKDFIGVTPLSDQKDAVVDIVAVSGLGGHALGSFRSRDGMSVWLRDFAPKDIPQARFITYGYDTTVISSHSSQGIRGIARTLLDALATFRHNTQTEKRPVCFVCHGLGGVVLKAALVLSSGAIDLKHDYLHHLRASTHGLILLGVPNLGLQHDQLMTIVKNRSNEDFVRDLLVRRDGQVSQFLDGLTTDFANLCKRQQPHWEILSYYETLESSTIEALENGEYTMTGQKVLMVTKSSAERISNEVSDIDHIASHTDHQGLVRFDHPQDERYVPLIGNIKMITERAPDAVHKRLAQLKLAGW